MLQKAWVIEDNKRKLIKGTYSFSLQEPFNEWLASSICKRLGFDYCDYSVEFNNKTKLISKCDCFIKDDEEIISAFDVFKSKVKPNGISDYEFYISILEEHGLVNARKDLENMIILDYLIVNSDRHMKNFGIIRNVETLKWLKLTPIFDSGESMQCDKYTDEIDFNRCYGKFFDINSLDGLANEYESLLKMFQSKLDISDNRINKLVNGLNIRISKLNKHIMVLSC